NPLAPPLAHLFMVRVENKALNLGLVDVLSWWRYVDDIYVRLRKKIFDRINGTVDRLNSIHPSIQFTVELESDGVLPSLDVSCRATNKRNGTYETSVYKKPTHTNQYVNWESAHPNSQKLGIFLCPIQSSKRICSPSIFEAEKQKLKEIFLDNGYPEDRLNHVIHRFENPKPQVPGAEALGKNGRTR
ncbi:MAG: hypothetical protein GY696_07440, partial [Gammaproteobacteria bacterium]|nr:hypothetical protein [Gammaproteobacteria bacterium]